MKKNLIWSGLALLAVSSLALGACNLSSQEEEKTIDFILDWTPNTNHTGLYVALEKGYFEEEGVKVDIKLPSEDSSSDLVINGKAPFAIYFQDSMAKKLEKGAGITAVAALVENNTSGIISAGDAGILSPKDLVGKKYGTWNDPIELAMLETLVSDQGGGFCQGRKGSQYRRQFYYAHCQSGLRCGLDLLRLGWHHGRRGGDGDQFLLPDRFCASL